MNQAAKIKKKGFVPAAGTTLREIISKALFAAFSSGFKNPPKVEYSFNWKSSPEKNQLRTIRQSITAEIAFITSLLKKLKEPQKKLDFVDTVTRLSTHFLYLLVSLGNYYAIKDPTEYLPPSRQQRQRQRPY